MLSGWAPWHLISCVNNSEGVSISFLRAEDLSLIELVTRIDEIDEND